MHQGWQGWDGSCSLIVSDWQDNILLSISPASKMEFVTRGHEWNHCLLILVSLERVSSRSSGAAVADWIQKDCRPDASEQASIALECHKAGTARRQANSCTLPDLAPEWTLKAFFPSAA